VTLDSSRMITEMGNTVKTKAGEKIKYGPRHRRRSKGHGPFVDIQFEFVQHHSSPRAALMVAHGFIELLVSALISEKCVHGRKINDAKRDFTHSAKLVLLNELGIVDNGWYKRLDLLRRIRNRAAHEPLFEVVQSDLEVQALPPNWVGLEAIEALNIDQQFVQRLHLLLGAFWNEYRHVFSRIFGAARISPALLFPPHGPCV
jgi:hypothetical protein